MSIVAAGMKLKQVDGHSIAGLSFHQALELVKAAPRCAIVERILSACIRMRPFVYGPDSVMIVSRPVTLSFVDTELPTIGDTLGMSPTTSGTGPASNSLTSTTDLMSDESSAIYSTDASQMSNLGESGYTVRAVPCSHHTASGSVVTAVTTRFVSLFLV